MKRLFSILAVAAAIVAACAVSSCNKETNPILGTWVNEGPYEVYGEPGTRKITYTFNQDGSVFTYVYYNDDPTASAGNAGTYTFSSPTVSMSFTDSVTPHYYDGTLANNEFTVVPHLASEGEPLVFTKAQ